ncbi:aminomethyl transferase family protein [Amycolatopsis rhabdoformis]|uniref:Aminomethyl transferase family protein n=1 Tax=Amycolatopsis rhabdoformis TaxID=1448059 RepID=A0ABZ1I6A1_9PSEU|nr:aminomethyl transferase family protein [Amycolatopsis rhabdoformis]WSE29923.1 aminomethyl transferase family protein [Amycolatopsis rhabdoformis]
MPENLEQKIQRIGDPVTMMRNSPAGHYEFPIPNEFSNWGDEQNAWKNTAVLFDQSFHMTDVYFRGSRLKEFFASIAVNSFATFGPDKAKQLVTVSPHGFVIGDGILFGLGEEEFSLVGRPSAPNYAAFRAETGDFDIEVTRDVRSLERNGRRLTFRYQLQGPNALDVMAKAYGKELPKVKFFNIGHFEIAGVRVRALNHTMSRHTGLEITGPSEFSAQVKEALLTAGEEFGLREGGALSYATTPTESGWIPSPTPAIYSGDALRAYREYLPGASWEGMVSLGGSYVADSIDDYYQTPWELGYGRHVKFDHDFTGREALEKLADQPHRHKVWLRWNDDDVTTAIARSYFGGADRTKRLGVPSSVYSTCPFDVVHVGGRRVGLSTYSGYTTNVGSWSSLAMLDEAEARDGREVTVVWGEPDNTAKPIAEAHRQIEIRATVSTTSLAD